jgi:hypothetical protein
VTVTGTIWQVGFSERGRTTCATNTNVPDVYSDSGKTIKNPSNTQRRGTMVIKFLLLAKNGDVSVSWGIVGSWGTT